MNFNMANGSGEWNFNTLCSNLMTIIQNEWHFYSSIYIKCIVFHYSSLVWVNGIYSILLSFFLFILKKQIPIKWLFRAFARSYRHEVNSNLADVYFVCESFKEKSHSRIYKQTMGIKYPSRKVASGAFCLGCNCLTSP